MWEYTLPKVRFSYSPVLDKNESKLFIYFYGKHLRYLVGLMQNNNNNN